MGAIERAAEAIHQLSNSDPWEREHPYLRGEYRADARAAFLAIDVDELSQVIDRELEPGVDPDRIARRIRSYLLGDDQ